MDIHKEKEPGHQKEIFTSLITHELKTPLTSLQGYVQLAERQLHRLQSTLSSQQTTQQKLVDEALSMLSRAQEQLSVQKRMLTDLLDISRVQEGTFGMHMAPCDLVCLVRETVQEYQDAHPQRLIALDSPAQETLSVQADKDRIAQVLSNYLENALKYSSPDKPIQVGITSDVGRVRVWVADQGPGLSQEAQQCIWERFYRAPDIEVQTRPKVRLGLGLSICREIIKGHGGEVGVESTPGQGSRFWFTLPLSYMEMGNYA